jgi:2-polyprenyl-3-methyl-5-hydroxy-6-metoxy-1,4-benzoquinol methylase
LLWATIVLLAVCLLWLALFVLFLPFLLISELLGWRARLQRANEAAFGIAGINTAGTGPMPAAESTGGVQFIFDRRKDVSKLFGCNTRNVQYRWQLFARRLIEIQNEFKEPNVLDFGAGSLRDSYELSKLGFRVVSVDLDETLLKSYHDSYSWDGLPSSPRLFTDSLDDLLPQTGSNFFHLAIAFDVVEHLEDPAACVKKIRSLLHERGLLFTIVPNRRSIFERYFKYTIRKQREKGLSWTPGVPHLQFRTPSEWEEFFAHNGFKIVEHDMTVGFFVNDCWNGLMGLPLRIFVCPVMLHLAHLLRVRFNAAAFEEAFSPAWLMERVNVWDMTLKKRFKNRFGWNLIVAQRKA